MDKFLEFLRTAQPGIVFVVLGLLLLLAAALLKKEGTFLGFDYTIDEKGRGFCRITGIILLALGIVLVVANAIVSLVPPSGSKDLHAVLDSFELALLVVIVIGVILGFISVKTQFGQFKTTGEFLSEMVQGKANGPEGLGALVGKLGGLGTAPEKMANSVNQLIEQIGGLKAEREELQKAVRSLGDTGKDLAAKVEDATRRVLTSFPEVFDRAFCLINCDKEEDEKFRELWVVNFALNFGFPHVKNPQMLGDYNLKTGRNLEDDVNTFSARLKEKAQYTPLVNILTITHERDSANFLGPLCAMKGYDALKDGVTFSGTLAAIKEEAAYYLDHIAPAHRDKRDWPKVFPHRFRFFQVDSLPIQLLIVRQMDGEYRCLVFMVGTEALRATAQASDDARPHAIGFYTQLGSAVDVYRGLADALMSQRIDEKYRCEES